jgi:hypothetical protein
VPVRHVLDVTYRYSAVGFCPATHGLLAPRLTLQLPCHCNDYQHHHRLANLPNTSIPDAPSARVSCRSFPVEFEFYQKTKANGNGTNRLELMICGCLKPPKQDGNSPVKHTQSTIPQSGLPATSTRSGRGGYACLHQSCVHTEMSFLRKGLLIEHRLR